MRSRPPIVLTGNDLSFSDITAIGRGKAPVALDPDALKRCAASRDFLEKAIGDKKVIYGVNTSFGPMCNKIIHEDEIEALQENLIISHAAGLGDALDPRITLGILAVRLNTLAKGYSGVRLDLLHLMKDMINAGIAPFIPECGSVGASGDLIHLAHMSLAPMGKGKVHHKGEWKNAAQALSETGLSPIRLSFKEGLALINGTAAMTGIAAFALADAQKLINLACVSAAFAIEIFGGIDDAFAPDLHRLRPHPGQLAVAHTVKTLYRGTRNLSLRSRIHDQVRVQEDRKTQNQIVYETDITVQDVYSLRCTPQVLAPVKEAFDAAVATLEIEANSTNDNPVVLPEKQTIIHGGNFHGQSIAFAMDSLSMALSTLCNLSERRTNKLFDRNLNLGLPEHLIAGEPGLTMGFMGAQFLTTSTTAEIRQLAGPMGIHSISCNASNQDVVSMGTVAARKALNITNKAKHVLSLEIMADLQALNFRHSQGLGRGTGKLFELLNEKFEVYDNTRIFHEDLSSLETRLFSGDLFQDLAPYLED